MKKTQKIPFLLLTTTATLITVVALPVTAAYSNAIWKVIKDVGDVNSNLSSSESIQNNDNSLSPENPLENNDTLLPPNNDNDNSPPIITDAPQIDNNDNTSNQQDFEFRDGILQEYIINKINESKKLNIKISEINPNEFGLETTKDYFLNSIYFHDFIRNNDINYENIIYDIYIFLSKIYESANGKLDLFIENSAELYYQTEWLKNGANTFELNLKFTIFNPYYRTVGYKINNFEISIQSQKAQTINLIIPKQEISFDLNEGNYLIPQFNNVKFLIEQEPSKSLEFSKFSFLTNQFSFASPYKVKNIFAIDKDYINENKFSLNSLSEEKLKNDVENEIMNLKDKAMNLISSFSNIIDLMLEEEPLDVFLNNASSYIANILVNMDLIPSNWTRMIRSLLNSKNPVTKVIRENTKAFSELIAKPLSSIGLDLSDVESILSIIGPDMTNSHKELILDFANFIPNNEFKYFFNLITDLLFKNKNIYEILDYIFNGPPIIQNNQISTQAYINHFNSLYKILESFLPNDLPAKDILSLCKFIFKHIDNNGTFRYQSILGLLTSDKNKVTGFIKVLFSAFGVDGIDTFVNALYLNNNNINSHKIKMFLLDFVRPLLNFIISPWNATATGYFIKDSHGNDIFNLNKESNKISYLYDLTFKFDRRRRIDLRPLYNLLPDTINLSGVTIPFWLVKLLGYLPDYIEIGGGDTIDVQFKAENDFIYLTPQKHPEKKGYYFKYTIPYNANVKLNMPKLYSSIFSQYKSFVGAESSPITPITWSFITSAIRLFLMVDYNFFGLLSFSNENYINVNYLKELPNTSRTFKWKHLNGSGKSKIVSFLENKDSLKFVVKTKENKEIKMVGKKPYIISGKDEEIMNLLFDLGTGIHSLEENKKPIIKITPHINGSIQIVGTIASFTLRIITVDVYFPDDRIIDLNRSIISKSKYVYNNHYKKTIIIS